METISKILKLSILMFFFIACGQRTDVKETQKSETELKTEVIQKMDALTESAKSKFRNGDNKGSLEDYNQLLNSNVGSILDNKTLGGIYYNRGVVKYAEKDYQGAIEDYTKAIALNQSDADAYYNRSITKRDIGDKVGAFEDMTKSMELEGK